jgi:hypothetical protein
MPYTVKKGNGKRPWKIVAQNGRQVGSSTTKKDAQASARVRNGTHRKGKRDG